MCYQILISPQVKRCAIIAYKHGIYEFSHEFQNSLRFRICCEYPRDTLVPSLRTIMKVLLIPAENS